MNKFIYLLLFVVLGACIEKKTEVATLPTNVSAQQVSNVTNANKPRAVSPAMSYQAGLRTVVGLNNTQIASIEQIRVKYQKEFLALKNGQKNTAAAKKLWKELADRKNNETRKVLGKQLSNKLFVYETKLATMAMTRK